MSNIEQKIAELLRESNKAAEQVNSLEENAEGWKKPADEDVKAEAPAQSESGESADDISFEDL